MISPPLTRVEEWRGTHDNRLAVEIFDAPSEASVAFLHGGGQSRHLWRRAAFDLQARGIASLSFDQRGHGDSDWMADANYSLESFAADTHCILRQWARPVILIGVSLGGLVSLIAAGQGIPGLRGLVMVDTAPQLNAAEVHRFVEFFRAGAGEGFASLEQAAAHCNHYFPGLGLNAVSLSRALQRTGHGRWVWRWDTRMVLGPNNSIALAYEDSLHDYAAAVRAPFMLVRAGASRLVSDAAVTRLRSHVPQLEVLTVDGLEHMFGSEQGATIVARLHDFLQRAASAHSGG